MSNSYGKVFISAREFVESWDKEIYELTHLDYFIYLLVNHLGNQLENRFFVQGRQYSRLGLNFEQIGNLCFNLGDSFEYFLEEDCCDQSEDRYILEYGTRTDMVEHEEELFDQRIKQLKSMLSKDVQGDQTFRVDLMEHVVLDTLLQFYYEEIGIEIEEEDLEIIELADFILDVIMDYICNEGQSLLNRPNDPAIEYFEGMLEAEEDAFQSDREWATDESAGAEGDLCWSQQENHFEELKEVIQRFVNDRDSNPPEAVQSVTRDAHLFQEFLLDHLGIHNIYELSEEHFLEFFSVWLVQRLAQEREPEFQRIFKTIARLVTWLSHHYNIDHKNSFKKYYEFVKTEVPRVVNALNAYLDEYDLFQVLLLRGKAETNQVSGFYEIKRLRNRIYKTLDLENVHLSDIIENVRLNSSIYTRLKPGDVLQATFIQKGSKWEILEIHYIYPKVSKPFVY